VQEVCSFANLSIHCVSYVIVTTSPLFSLSVVYYESRKRELKTRPIYECQCNERLKTKTEKSTRLTFTGSLGELEHLKIKTRLIDEMFTSVMGEYVFLK
jgi:hypothetical protein